MGEFEYSEDRSQATVFFPAHKFPSTESVYYDCNVTLCSLKDATCKEVSHLAAMEVQWNGFSNISPQ